jgi:hypothetical protein
MKEELDTKLCEDFPLLYADRHADMRVTCMCWGFPGDGWEPLIRRLSEKLERAIAAMPEGERPRAAQVKEKFGTLRFCMTSETEEMSAWIQEAEDESAETCETCGAPGKLRGKGWLYTACDEHVIKRLHVTRAEKKP